MNRVVWISPHVPYPSVPHAGGKIENFYLTNLINSKKFDIRLISFYKPDEINKVIVNDFIHCDLFCYYDKGIRKLSRNLMDLNYLKNPFHKYANSTTYYLKTNILRTLKLYRIEKYIPDVVVLQWTQVVYFAKEIKRIFPTARIVAIEEDVTLLSYKRRINIAKNKTLAKLRFRNIEKSEIAALEKCDLIISNNKKDEKLLEKYGLGNKVKRWTPYYQNFLDNKRNEELDRSILFYGAMSRPENYLSVQWFIQNVFYSIENLGLKLIIIGGNPDHSLKQYENKNIVLKGFVDDISPFFSSAVCLVAPLVLGAGIKIKILEAMSAGLPVLTNDIGIEGISARSGIEYIHCTTPEDYKNGIERLLRDIEFNKSMGELSKLFIKNEFDYDNDSNEFINWIDTLIVKGVSLK